MRVIGDIKQTSCSQTQLGRALGLSTARINQLIEEKVVVRDETATNGAVMLFESLQNYFLSKNTSSEGVNFWKEKGLHEKAKRELAELKLAERRGELYEATVVENVMTEQLTNFRAKLLGLPAKLSSQLEGKSRAAIYAALTSAIEENLEELSAGYEGADLCEAEDISTELRDEE